MLLKNNNAEFHTVVGDRTKALGRTLYNGSSVEDLTNKTVQFLMTDQEGVVVVNWASATVVSAAAGTVKYSFAANDVDTAGLYYGWFRVVSSGPTYATYPAAHQGIPIFIHDVADDENY